MVACAAAACGVRVPLLRMVRRAELAAGGLLTPLMRAEAEEEEEDGRDMGERAVWQ